MKRLVALVGMLALAACQGERAPAPQVSTVLPPAAVAAPPVGPLRPTAVVQRDQAIATALETRLRGEADARALRGVGALVWNGRVVLFGAVPKPWQRRRAEQLARAIAGVAEVANDLVMAEDGALDLFIPDTALAQAIRDHLGLTAGQGPLVRVVNGVAFLVGGSADPAQAEALREDAGEVAGIKWVVAHLDY